MSEWKCVSMKMGAIPHRRIESSVQIFWSVLSAMRTTITEG